MIHHGVRRKTNNSIKFLLLFLLIFGLLFVGLNILLVPNEILLIHNGFSQESFFKPGFLKINMKENGIIRILEHESDLKSVFNSGNTSVQPTSAGETEIRFDLFGILPIKTTNVRVLDNREVLVSGKSIGVHLNIGGVLVLAVSTVNDTEGKSVSLFTDDSIVKGDIIRKVNDIDVKSVEALKTIVQDSKGNEISILAQRGDRLVTCSVRPVISKDDGEYKLGLWVRDASAGIGTLTFYDGETGWYGALGHGISDTDTGVMMPVGTGRIFNSNIMGIRKGAPGAPGEFKGMFNMQKEIGNIKINNEFGIYGTIDKNKTDLSEYTPYKVGSKNKIKLGKAYILCQGEDNTIGKYEIEIVKVSKNITSGSKGIVLTITDPKLLEQTGGIIQGMSGSPIIQNDMLVGAVTHVFVNDPKKGYGIFIECMLNEIEKYNNKSSATVQFAEISKAG
jgi:stage IV sporulation protein B